jgi:hypothetical protein
MSRERAQNVAIQRRVALQITHARGYGGLIQEAV